MDYIADVRKAYLDGFKAVDISFYFASQTYTKNMNRICIHNASASSYY